MFVKMKPLYIKILMFPCLFIFASMMACTFEVGVLEPTPTPDSENEVQVIDLGAVVGTVEQKGSQPFPTETSSVCEGSPLAGLLFSSRDRNTEALWQIGACGALIQLTTESDVRISPDGKHALYTREDDIWIFDLSSGDIQNLTNTPDRIEVRPQWWKGNRDLVIFGSWDTSEDVGFSTGYLSIVSTDGSGYQVLAEQPSNGTPAPQPDGSMLAYDLADSAWIYHRDKDEIELFDVNLYGLDVHNGMKIGSPSWSPDGGKLSWWIGGDFAPSIDGSVALAVFDLEAKSVEVLHTYSAVGSAGWFPQPVWSSDGQWLAATTLGEAHKVDLWLIHSGRKEKHLLGFASNPVWHPDSGALIYQAWSDDVVKLIALEDWQLQTLDLPPGSTPVDWPDAIFGPSIENQLPTPEAASTIGQAIYFATRPEMAGSRSVFPFGTPEIFAIFPYRNMREGLTIRREWYLDGDLWLESEETWDFAQYGAEGILTDISVHDFDHGLKPGRYQLRLYINGQEQQLGLGEVFSSAFFEVSAPIEISPQVSPDYSQMAIVEPPGSLTIQDVESQKKKILLTVEEISSIAWHPNGKHILFSVRDRSGEDVNRWAPSFSDELWVVNLDTGESYIFQDQFGQHAGEGLHHPNVSPDGLYLAAIEGSGWTDACFVASKLWVKEIGLNENRIHEVYSFDIHSFTISSAPKNGETHVERIIGWESPSRLIVELDWTCTTENLDGIYMFDMSTMAAEKIGGSK